MTVNRPVMSEGQLLDSVVDLASLLGILLHHSRPARTSRGWVTALTGDKGLPDLVLAGTRGVLFRELKRADGRLSPEQRVWLDRLARAGSDAAVWRPVDWPDRIRRELEAIR